MNKSGETLIEVVMALSVFMVVLAPAGALYVSSLRTINTNRNDLAAAALAEEGVELVRNARDTNVLKFSPKADLCWNTVASHTALSTCDDAANKIAGGSYRVGMNVGAASLPLFMEPQTAGLTDALEAAYQLKLDEDALPGCTGAPSEPACHTHFVDDTHLYHHGNSGTVTDFFREVKLEYIGGDVSTATAVRVTSTVKYSSGANRRTIARSVILTNQPQ